MPHNVPVPLVFTKIYSIIGIQIETHLNNAYTTLLFNYNKRTSTLEAAVTDSSIDLLAAHYFS